MGIDVARRLAIAVCLLALSASAQAEPVAAPPTASPPMPGGITIQVRTLEIRDITLGSIDNGTVAIGRGLFSGVQPDGAVVKVDRISLEGVVAQLRDRTVTAPEIAISNAELPTEIFRLLTEGGGRTLDWPSLLESTAIKEIVIPAVREEYRAGSTGSAYGQLALTDIRAGVAESGQIATIVAENKLPRGGGAALKAGPLSWRGINIAELVRFFTGGHEGEPVRLIESAELKEFSVTSKDTSVSVDRIEISGVHGRAPVSPTGPEPAGLVNGPPGQNSADTKSTARYLREMLRHHRIDRYRLSGVKIRSTDNGSLSIAGVTIGDLSGTGLGKFEIDGLAFADEETTVKVARFSVEKLVYGPIVDLTLRAIEQGQEPDVSPAQLAESAPRVGAIHLADLVADTTAGRIVLGKAALEVEDPDATVPERVSLVVSGLALDLEKMPPGDGRDELLDLGYRELAGDVKVGLRWFPGERAFVIDETMLAIDNVGRVEVGVRLGNVDLTAVAADPEVIERMMDAATIQSIEVRIADGGLADRFFSLIARRSGTSQAEARAALASEIRAEVVDLLGSALVSGAPKALEAFILKPKRLVVRVLPRQGQAPLSMGDLDRLDASQINARVRITIEAPAD